MTKLKIQTNYYRQFDADYTLEIPAEGYGGWQKTDLEIHFERTALIMMHVCDVGPREEYPGWFRAVEYIPRSYDISENVLKPLVDEVRRSGMQVIHVPMNRNYVSDLPGYREVEALCPADAMPPPEKIEEDDVLKELREFKMKYAYPGEHNLADIRRGSPRTNFPEGLGPVGDETVALTSEQLFAVCKRQGINHLIYTGYAINWCLLISPGGMFDMSRRGMMCSAVRQAVTAVENKESARLQGNKETALWRVALAYGFVYDDEDLIAALQAKQG